VITEQQYQKFMKTLRENGGVVGHAPMKAGMHPQTAGRYLAGGESPEERQGHACVFHATVNSVSTGS
jgi:hypothetical protein